ncbi:ATP-binding protein [Mycobacteroides salmoniphilum]|uniref:AAA+ ATPase domain-containing protein n=1 Tax=Mycobacteroides salmoniphilum TaxID=404941 RepID=A0A4R8SZX6_9MYCO|nr:ATP-binding protein [Mycobacteroides salmoniphilum]TEA09153.1 hypothetical protein CCUG60884_00322 [Mycobacteroides salmoniphilum]
MFSIVKPDFAQYRNDLIMEVFPLAMTADGQEDMWMPQNGMRWRPHLFIDGPLGSGKTTTAQNLVIQASRNGSDVHVLRQFGREYSVFEDWPGVSIASTPAEYLALLADADNRGIASGRMRPVLVVVDTISLLADLGKAGLDSLLQLVNRRHDHRINLVLVADPTGSDDAPGLAYTGLQEALVEPLYRVEIWPPPSGLEARLPEEISQWRPSERSE